MKKKKLLSILCAAAMLAMSGCSGVVSEFVGYETEESPIIGESNTSTSPADNSSAEKTAFGGSSM